MSCYCSSLSMGRCDFCTGLRQAPAERPEIVYSEHDHDECGACETLRKQHEIAADCMREQAEEIARLNTIIARTLRKEN